jgi:outer membrane protein assembly factor BamB
MRESCWIILLALISTPALADPNWPQFRGPRSTGATDETGYAGAWSPTENVVWRTDIPGRGWSSPIVWEEKIFLTTAVSAGKEEEPKKGLYLGGDRSQPSSNPHRWKTICIDFESGKVRWEREARHGRPPSSHHIKNSLASETPVTDGERVIAYFGNLGVFAYDLDGRPLWSKELKSHRTRNGWGTASSPVLHRGRVYIQNDNEERSVLLALDAGTGAQLWEVVRSEKSNWSTPFIWENAQRTEIVTNGTGKVRSYGLEGKLLWEMSGMSTITIPTPFAAGGLLYVASGFVMDGKRPIVALRPGASGDIGPASGDPESEFIAWSDGRAAPYNPSPVIYQGRIYVLYDRGFLACYDAATGKEVYGRQRLSSEANAFTASPWAAGGKVFCLSEDGECFVIEAGPEYKLLRTNSLDELCMASPALARGSLFIRTLGRLYRIAAGK